MLVSNSQKKGRFSICHLRVFIFHFSEKERRCDQNGGAAQLMTNEKFANDKWKMFPAYQLLAQQEQKTDRNVCLHNS